MKTPITFASYAALAACSIHAIPAQATLPPPAPPEYAAYGPLQLCSNRLVIEIGQDEAVHIVGDIVRVINDREILAIKFANDRYWFSKEDGSLAPGKAKSFKPKRFFGPTPDAGNTLSYAPHGLQAQNARYSIALGGETQPMIVGATAFDGSSSDQRLLDRIRPVTEQAPDCLPLWYAIRKDSESEMGKRVKPNWYRWADAYRQVLDEGPGFYCTGGIGFEVKAGEKIRRPWRSLGHSSPAFVESSGTSIKFEARGKSIARLDPQDANEHPMSLLRKSEITYFPSRGVGPPYAQEGVREAGSWNVILDVNGASRAMEISFPASEKTGAGFNFLERLQFVDASDPRCGKTGQPPLQDPEQAAASPKFIRVPSTADIGIAYPRAAFRKGLSGSVVLDCASENDGGLADCRVVSENPAGHGFGLAALRLSRNYRLEPPSTQNSSRQPDRVKFGLNFTTADN
jgi:TonB family protein